MPYRNVYEEQISRHGQHGAQEPEKDPKKIEEIYRAQILTDEEYEERKTKLTKSNLQHKQGVMVNSAYDGKFDRGIRKSILGRSQNRGR